MEIKFTVEDIRNHLSELGYKSVPQDKLNTFVSDLQRLIKYEEKRKHLDRKLGTLDSSASRQPSDHRKKRERRRSHRINESSTDVPDDAHADRTDMPDARLSATDVTGGRTGGKFSSARIFAGLEKTSSRSVHTTRSLHTTTVGEEGSTATTSSTVTSSIHEQLHHTEQSSLYVDIVIPKARSTETGERRTAPFSATLLDKRSLPPNSGVIRCRSTAAAGGGSTGQVARRGRSDPVRLHTEYRKAWDKLNLPGETSHNKLRWAVRGWMMGEEPC
jgi:hypothetical protein